ncbi:2-phosphosulfolactate phosphatase [Limibacter armeniacum]|uniref:2-phosphosulfolactate phosphatase n=1 Tax=Limibacter armeniacum TaxID=466084 RepID=UPI002FE579D5
MRIEVCHSPELIHLFDLSGKIAVVTDILRATSCMVAGIGSGAEQIVPVAQKEEVNPYKEKGFVTAGERGGEKIEGFDIGNSPFEHMEIAQKGKSVVMTTTNGTVAITKSAVEAKQVIIGAFLNISSVVQYLKESGKDIVIVCSGWKGMFSMEDTLFAGALVDRLESVAEIVDDAALSSMSLYRAVSGDLLGYMQNASHAKRLSGLKAVKDLEYCMTKDEFDVIPVLKDGALVKM